ncbi:DUF6285 domain-containing protein [Ectopseudomonas hydrolytica]|uniref:DUF6285 domain-containing protein n=1 Tax=Ectopseudomonas hydrolytica TaxID=2493633 RepID=UPI003EE064AF
MTTANAKELLSTARGLLLAEVLPALPPHLHYECRMIASALAMAAREITDGDRAVCLEVEALAQILQTQGEETTSRDAAVARVSELIRQGVFDRQASRQLLLEGLLKITQARLTISNPRVLTDDR